MLRKFSASLISPVLFIASSAQPSLSQKPQADLSKRLSLYSAPGVVRVVTGCFSEYSSWAEGSKVGAEPSKFWIRGAYPTADPQVFNKTGFNLGTGFFINSNGYVATSASLVKTDLTDKKKCREHLVDRLAERYFGTNNKENEDLISRFKAKLNAGQPFEQSYVDPKTGEEKYEFKYGLRYEDIQWYRHIILPNGEKIPFDYIGRRSELGGGGRSGKDVAILKVEINHTPTLKLESSDEVQVQERVAVLAYPPTAELEVDPTRVEDDKGKYNTDLQAVDSLVRNSKLVLTITDSYISSPLRKLPNGASILQVNGPAVYGTFGGPVVDEQNQVIGMVSYGRDYTYVIPASTIRDFVGDAGTTNEAGKADQMYREGLEFYWQGDYKSASDKFKRVKSLFPQHSEVDELIRQSEAAMAISDERFPLPWLALIAVGTGAAAIAAVTAFLLGRRGTQPSPVTSAPTLPVRETRKRGQSAFNNYHPGTAISTNPFIKLTYKGQELTFDLDDDTYNLGRDPNWSDLRIPNEWKIISGHHAILQKEGDDFRIYDGDGQQPSTNGTFFKDSLIDALKGHLLSNGNQLKIGKNPNDQVLLTYFNPAKNQSNYNPTVISQ